MVRISLLTLYDYNHFVDGGLHTDDRYLYGVHYVQKAFQCFRVLDLIYLY